MAIHWHEMPSNTRTTQLGNTTGPTIWELWVFHVGLWTQHLLLVPSFQTSVSLSPTPVKLYCTHIYSLEAQFLTVWQYCKQLCFTAYCFESVYNYIVCICELVLKNLSQDIINNSFQNNRTYQVHKIIHFFLVNDVVN